MAVIFALWKRNLKAFWRNKPALIINALFPLFFIFVFGEIFRNDYIENAVPFMMAGIAIAMVFDSALRISANTIDDITSGFMKEVLVSPVSRLTIALGQFASSATIATLQGIVILCLGFFLGLTITSAWTLVFALIAMIAIGFVFAGFGLFIATRAKNIQTYQAVSMALTMPMTFLSGAFIPLSMLNDILRTIAYFNPMTYGVALFRSIMLERLGDPADQLVATELAIRIGDFTITPLYSALILLVFGVIFITLATISFVKLDFSKMNRNKADSLEFE